jgi:hypothetical protein
LQHNTDNSEYHLGFQCARCKVVQKRAQPVALRDDGGAGDTHHCLDRFAADQWSVEHTTALVELYDLTFGDQPKAYTAHRIVLNFVRGTSQTT